MKYDNLYFLVTKQKDFILVDITVPICTPVLLALIN